jgi:hypothetical protein
VRVDRAAQAVRPAAGAVRREEEAVSEHSGRTLQEGLKGVPLLPDEEFVSRTVVTPELIRTYAQVVGETNPRFLDESAPGGMIAPPTFFYATGFDGGLRNRERPAGGGTSLLAADHAEFFGDIRPGDVVVCVGRPVEEYTKTGRSGTLHFTVAEFRWINQRGEVVTFVRRSSASSSTIQPPAPSGSSTTPSDG